VFENKVVRRTFGLRSEEVIGGWRRLHDEEVHNLYAFPNVIRVVQSRRMRWAGHEAHMAEMRNSYILDGKSEKTSWKT